MSFGHRVFSARPRRKKERPATEEERKKKLNKGKNQGKKKGGKPTRFSDPAVCVNLIRD
jgi:hypothetical protein